MAEYEKRREAFRNGQPFWSDAERTRVAVATAVDLAIAAIEQARTTGLPPDRTGILDLERFFIGRLQAGDLPIQVAERIYKLLEREEQRLDQGDRADLKRRARLEEAYVEFLASRPPCRLQSAFPLPKTSNSHLVRPLLTTLGTTTRTLTAIAGSGPRSTACWSAWRRLGSPPQPSRYSMPNWSAPAMRRPGSSS
jgi:hypothetical protein